MDFTTLQKAVMQNAINYGKKFDVTIDQDFALLKLYEEAGGYLHGYCDCQTHGY